MPYRVSTVMLANRAAMPILASGHLTGGRKPVVACDRFAGISLAYHKPMVAAESRWKKLVTMISPVLVPSIPRHRVCATAWTVWEAIRQFANVIGHLSIRCSRQ